MKTKILAFAVLLAVLNFAKADYFYYKAIHIYSYYNLGEGVAVQLPLTIDTASLISAGKLRSDCADLRFRLTADTSNQSPNEMPYYIESGCNTLQTKIWVWLRGSFNQTIYMVYGNPNENVSLSNPLQVFDAYYDANTRQMKGIEFLGNVTIDTDGALKIVSNNNRWQGIRIPISDLQQAILKADIDYYGDRGGQGSAFIGLLDGNTNLTTLGQLNVWNTITNRYGFGELENTNVPAWLWAGMFVFNNTMQTFNTTFGDWQGRFTAYVRFGRHNFTTYRIGIINLNDGTGNEVFQYLEGIPNYFGYIGAYDENADFGPVIIKVYRLWQYKRYWAWMNESYDNEVFVTTTTTTTTTIPSTSISTTTIIPTITTTTIPNTISILPIAIWQTNWTNRYEKGSYVLPNLTIDMKNINLLNAFTINSAINFYGYFVLLAVVLLVIFNTKNITIAILSAIISAFALVQMKLIDANVFTLLVLIAIASFGLEILIKKQKEKENYGIERI